MSGNYPDGLNQSEFDQYWKEKLDDCDVYEVELQHDVQLLKSSIDARIHRVASVDFPVDFQEEDDGRPRGDGEIPF